MRLGKRRDLTRNIQDRESPALFLNSYAISAG